MDPVLQSSAMRGDIEGLNKLLEDQPLLLDEILPPFSKNPLHVAALAGQTEYGRKLVRHRHELALERAEPGGLTPLHVAAAAGHTEFVKMIIFELSEDMTLEGDDQSNTPLHYAAAKGKVDVVRCLIEKEQTTIKNKNYKGENPLHLAVRSRHIDALEEMLKCISLWTADDQKDVIQAQANDGSTLLLLAASTRQNQIVDLLQSQGYRLKDQNEGYSRGNDEEAHNVSVEQEFITRRGLFDGDPLLSSGDALRVVGSMIASVTFQAVANPPPTIWKYGMKPHFLSMTGIFRFRHSCDTNSCAEERLGSFVTQSSISFIASIGLMIFFSNAVIASHLLSISLFFLLITHQGLILALSSTDNQAALIINILYLVPALVLTYHLMIRPMIKMILVFRKKFLATMSRVIGKLHV